MRKLLASIGVAAAALTGPVAGTVASASASTAAPAQKCVAHVHYSVAIGEKGNIKVYMTCMGNNHTFRAHAQCEKDNNSSRYSSNGSYRSSNNQTSTAGCSTGYYILNGGYEYQIDGNYHVLWRYTGHPLGK